MPYTERAHIYLYKIHLGMLPLYLASYLRAALGRFRSFSVINLDNMPVTFSYLGSSYAADQTVWNTTCDSPESSRQHRLIRLLRSNHFLTVDRIPNSNRNCNGRLG